MIARAWGIAVLLSIASAAAGQGSALRVVVLEGEDAVNIIQQKTAVAPLVEVRDRNNVPVSGALVTFSIEGGKAATFGGASTLTVATNAAGQAAVTGLTPSAAGAFQIQVSAAFQGQIATATIAQTNVMTAAQAAAASAASTSAGGSASGSAGGGGAGGASGGAAGGAGGGLSTTTIAIAGAAVAGGAVAATQVAGKDSEGKNEFTGSFTGTTIESVVSRNGGQTCTINRSVTATAHLTLDPNEPNHVGGNLRFEGTETVTATTCAGVTQVHPFTGGMPITGTQSAMRGSESTSSTSTGQGGESITGTVTQSFEGALSGSTVTGTLKISGGSTSAGSGGGAVDSQLAGTFPLTLTRSQ